MEDIIAKMQSDTEPTETDVIVAKKIGKSITPKERSKLYRENKLKVNPNWDKERMKKWRTTHPEAYNYGQARHFFRKLTIEQKTRLLNESQMPVLP